MVSVISYFAMTAFTSLNTINWLWAITVVIASLFVNTIIILAFGLEATERKSLAGRLLAIIKKKF